MTKMNDEIRIATLNVRGLNDSKKLLFIEDLCQREKIDILLMQETHFRDEKDVECAKQILNMYELYYMLGSNKTKGVCTMIKKSLNEIKIKSVETINVRAICLNLEIEEISISLCNIYAPNDGEEQIEFIEKLSRLLYGKKKILLAGDFNAVQNSCMDRQSSNRISQKQEKKYEKEWKKFMNVFDLNEFQNISKIGMTWENNGCASRIDRMHASTGVIGNYVKAMDIVVSDHKLVMASWILKQEKEIRGVNTSEKKKKSEWKLNDQILDDEVVDWEIRMQCNEIENVKKDYKDKWYEKFIAGIVSFLKRESREFNMKKMEAKNNIFKELYQLNKREYSGDSKHKKEQLKVKLNQYYEEQRVGLLKRNSEEKNNFLNQPTKILIEKEKAKYESSKIASFIDENEKKLTSSEEINEKIYSFYSGLLGKDLSNQEKLEKYEFKSKKFDENNKCRLEINNKITFHEVNSVIKKMKPSAPGPNGLTLAFYKKYFKYFGEHLVNLFNDSEVMLGKTFKEATIKLIPKNKKVHKTIDDLRPISLTNYEYRIYSKVLANRMRLNISQILGDSQTCSIPMRRMNDNIMLINDIIYECKLKNKKIQIVSLDQRKAFDSISHKYLYKLLDHLNIGEFMTKSIKRLYVESSARISLDGIKSKKIEINSGIKQGCPLSMILYILAIEECLANINSNAEIKGYKMIGNGNNEIKTGAYADDVIGIVMDSESKKNIFLEFKKWGEISGASLNEKKTKVLMVNQLEEQDSEIKILGIWFNKDGIAKKNFEIFKNKIVQTAMSWSRVKLTIFEKIAVAKTFLYSQIYFLANFVYMDKHFIKTIDSIIFKFLWNGGSELIKRTILCLPRERGGLNMFSLSDRLKTIYVRNFIYMYHSRGRITCKLSLYWLKFEMRDMGITNFNIIPGGDRCDRSDFYNEMSECVKMYKKIDKEFVNKFEKLSSKKIYSNFSSNEKLKPDFEKRNSQFEWEKIYKSLTDRKLIIELRELNYKILHNGLTLNIKISERMKMKCVICEKETETIEHIFVECKDVHILFDMIKNHLTDSSIKLSNNNIILSLNQSFRDKQIISIYKYSIWSLRNKLKHCKVENMAYFKKSFGWWLNRCENGMVET